MKCQLLFSGKNKKNIISLSSAELVPRVVKVKINELASEKEHSELKVIASILKGSPCLQNKISLPECLLKRGYTPW